MNATEYKTLDTFHDRLYIPHAQDCQSVEVGCRYVRNHS